MFLIPEAWYKIKTTGKKGRGVFALHDIPAGTVIGDYLGTIMRPKDEDEKKNGLYTMGGGEHYDILGNRKVKGVHFINHSCANNCDTYPYQGHMLFFAARKVFKGEEITINYWLCAEDDKSVTCDRHACRCGSQFCTGTMHHASKDFSAWDRFVRKQFGRWYKKVPGNYGSQLAPLKKYPASIVPPLGGAYGYDIFAAEAKSPQTYRDASVPSTAELHERISETGRRISLPKLKLTINGISNGILLAERTDS